MGTNNIEDLREQAREALAKVGTCDDDAFAAAKSLIGQPCEVRDYEMMWRLAEAVSRRDPKDAANRRLYGQCLIETGRVTLAIDLLEALVARLPATHPEHAEAMGLLGGACKQIFFDAGDKTNQGAREALERAIAIYRLPYEQNPANTWHGLPRSGRGPGALTRGRTPRAHELPRRQPGRRESRNSS